MWSMPKVCSAAENRRLVEDAAGRDPDLIEDGLRDRALEMADVVFEHLIGARHHHRQHLAHVADDDLEFWMPVERAGDHHAQHMHRGFRMPAPACGLEDAARALRQIGEISLRTASGGMCGWM